MMSAVVARARVLADIVLVDTAPAGTVNDALTLVQQVDATIVVARHGRTTRDQARRTLRLFGNLDAELLGVVLTDAPRTAAAYYGPDDYAASARAGAAAGRSR
jgi:Mrp family chromosome partitioning ATPase